MCCCRVPEPAPVGRDGAALSDASVKFAFVRVQQAIRRIQVQHQDSGVQCLGDMRVAVVQVAADSATLAQPLRGACFWQPFKCCVDS